MNLTSRQTIEFLCKKYGFWPQRSAGQNFLISEKILQEIVDAAQLTDTDTVLEIGGGFGTLTNELVGRAGQVITVELDKRLAAALKKISVVSKNLTVVEGDIFKQLPIIAPRLPDGQYKLVANLPYNITSFVLRNFLENKPRPSDIVVLVQKEVAERIMAKPGEMSVLAIAVQFFGAPEIAGLVGKENFWPEPEVDSAILRITGIGRDIHGYEGMLAAIPVKEFFRIVKIGFSAKRKQLHNNLAAGLRMDGAVIRQILAAIGVDPAVRAQNLTIAEWIKITKKLQ